MANNKTDSTKKVFDVAKPGKTAANPSARPVIIGHKPLLRDPMVKEASISELDSNADTQAAELSPEDKPSGGGKATSSARLLPPSELRIEPLKSGESTSLASGKSEESNSATKLNADEDAKPPEIQKDEPATQPEADQSTADNSDAAAVSNAAGQAEAKKLAAKQQQEQAAKQTAMEKLIAEKKYFVEIGEKKRRRSNRMALILLVLLLLVVGAYLLADAGIIKTSLNLPIELIKN